MADDKYVINKNLYQYIPNLLPSVEAQLMFNETTQNNYKISLDDYYTERPLISDMIVQVDIGSVQQINSPKRLICAHQTQNRIKVPNKNNNIATFDNLDPR